MTKEIVLILDFGSPYTQLIAQRVRENHVFSQIVPHNITAKEIKQQKPKGIIISSAPADFISKKKGPRPDRNIFKLKIPILGIGYGAKIIVKFYGGRVKPAKLPELKRSELFIDDTNHLFSKMPNNITSWMSYADYITKLPKGFARSAHTQDNPIAAIECSSKKVFAISFHPEVVSTQRGGQIISNFLYKICGCLGTWVVGSFVKEQVANIKKSVDKEKKVIINLDATIDSFVTALLINKVIKKRLKCFFIDTGLLRKDETKHIKRILGEHFHVNLKCLDRSQRFLSSLKGITKPEEKRKIIKNLKSKIFHEELKKIRGARYLAEWSASSDSNKDIANHFMKSRRINPLRDLFRDEVKVVAKELSLPDNIIFRQSFPECGLAMRIVGEVTTPRLKILREADECLIDEIKAAGIYEEVWQSFAVLLPERNVIAIRCIASVDGITADWVRLPYDIIERISRRILAKVKGINRVVYDISPKPPATIEWE